MRPPDTLRRQAASCAKLGSPFMALVLSGSDAALAAVYPPNEGPEAQLIDAVLAALTRHERSSRTGCKARRRPMRYAAPPRRWRSPNAAAWT